MGLARPAPNCWRKSAIGASLSEVAPVAITMARMRVPVVAIPTGVVSARAYLALIMDVAARRRGQMHPGEVAAQRGGLPVAPKRLAQPPLCPRLYGNPKLVVKLQHCSRLKRLV